MLRPEGNSISTELWVSVLHRPWCAHRPCQTLPRALFSTPLRMQYIRSKMKKKKLGLKIQCLSCHALFTASKQFAVFVLFHLQPNTQKSKLCWIPVYIRVCNILPHSENTFPGNNPIMLHFFGAFLLLSFVSLYTKCINFIFSSFQDDVWLY